VRVGGVCSDGNDRWIFRLQPSAGECCEDPFTDFVLGGRRARSRTLPGPAQRRPRDLGNRLGSALM
jgi:hypothetical protein